MIPYPYDAVPGVMDDPAERSAQGLSRSLSWLARIADQMNADAQYNLKLGKQLTEFCETYRRFYDELQAMIAAGTHSKELIAEIVGKTLASRKVSWPTVSQMNDDLLKLYNTAKDTAAWMEANAAQYKQGYSTNRVIATGVDTDDAIKIAKPAGLAKTVGDLRVLFGPLP